MRVKVNTKLPMESINQAVVLLIEDNDVEIEVECSNTFFQKLIDTKELYMNYRIFASTCESIRKSNNILSREFQHKNIFFFENFELDNFEARMYLKDNKDTKIELTI